MEKNVLTVTATDDGVRSVFCPDNEAEEFMIASFLATLFNGEKKLFLTIVELMMDEDFINMMKNHTTSTDVNKLFNLNNNKKKK